VFVISGGKAGGFAGGVDDGLIFVGDMGGGDGLFVGGGIGVVDDATSVAILLDKGAKRTEIKDAVLSRGQEFLRSIHL
jgi:hypothetical protein